MQTRVLNLADRQQIDKLRLTQTTHLGVKLAKFSSRPWFAPSYIDQYLEGGAYVGMGCFVDECLVSYAFGMFGEERWYLQMIMSSRSKRTRKINGLECCLEEIIKIAEARGIYEYMYSIPVKYRNAHLKLWASSSDLLASYDRVDVLTVPKYTKCNDREIFEQVMMNVVLPVDMLIKRVSKR